MFNASRCPVPVLFRELPLVALCLEQMPECLDHRIERSECNPIGQVVLKIVDVLPTRREQGELRAKPRKTTIQ